MPEVFVAAGFDHSYEKNVFGSFDPEPVGSVFGYKAGIRFFLNDQFSTGVALGGYFGTFEPPITVNGITTVNTLNLEQFDIGLSGKYELLNSMIKPYLTGQLGYVHGRVYEVGFEDDILNKYNGVLAEVGAGLGLHRQDNMVALEIFNSLGLAKWKKFPTATATATSRQFDPGAWGIRLSLTWFVWDYNE